MTYKEILSREEQNQDSIWLHREGMFMKAYERSAFFAHTLIHEFKLSKRYIKTVNMDVISLGFPEQTIPKWLNDSDNAVCGPPSLSTSLPAWPAISNGNIFQSGVVSVFGLPLRQNPKNVSAFVSTPKEKALANFFVSA